MAEDMTKEKEFLRRYIKLKTKVENDMERLARAKSAEQFPSARDEVDESKHHVTGTDRMGNAIIRRLSLEDRLLPRIAANKEKMFEIEDIVDSIDDPQESEVLRLRYFDGDNGRLVPWDIVALGIYRRDDENWVKSAQRLHGRALQSLRMVMQQNTQKEPEA